jgi:threonine/homoserine/homoserine lactone efflux protein
MGIIESISLFTIMVTLAIIPSTSVALVVTRSATLGVSNGIAVAIGIVLGDLTFILLVLLGMSVVAETMAVFFLIIKYLGGTYLLWLGLTLLTSDNTTNLSAIHSATHSSLITSFLAGVFLTLGDIKAIFFYVSLFPAFVDLSELNTSDIIIIVLITISTVGLVKISYVISAKKIVTMSQGLKLEKAARIVAGSFMIGAGSYLIIKT